jgi:hypothetical protein
MINQIISKLDVASDHPLLKVLKQKKLKIVVSWPNIFEKFESSFVDTYSVSKKVNNEQLNSL